jgi:hypothetical protein
MTNTQDFSKYPLPDLDAFWDQVAKAGIEFWTQENALPEKAAEFRKMIFDAHEGCKAAGGNRLTIFWSSAGIAAEKYGRNFAMPLFGIIAQMEESGIRVPPETLERIQELGLDRPTLRMAKNVLEYLERLKHEC